MDVEFDFLCQKCKKVHSVIDIAFSMTDEIFEDVKRKAGEELATFLSNNKQIFMCITTEDVYSCKSLLVTTGENGMGKDFTGEFTLRGDWLARRAIALDKFLGPVQSDEQKANISKLKNFKSDKELYTGYCKFRFIVIEGREIASALYEFDNTPLSTMRRCAHCGRILSPVTGMAPELRVVFQGSSVAGKTSVMVAMLNKLLEHAGEYDIKAEKLSTIGDEYTKWMNEELQWYRKGYNIRKTEKQQPEPRLYSVKISVGEKNLILTMVDMPGEFFDGNNGEDVMHMLDAAWFRQYADIYSCCHAVWTFMQNEMVRDVSGIQDKVLVEKIQENTGLPEDALSRANQDLYAQRFGEVKSFVEMGGHAMPPHAVILTKTDAIVSTTNEGGHLDHRRKLEAMGIIPKERMRAGGSAEDTKLLFTAKGRLIYNENVAWRMANNVRSYVRELNPHNYKVLDSFSDRRCYFALSAYGRPCKDRRKLPDSLTPASAPMNFIPEPYNVENPLLWTLAVSGQFALYYDVDYQTKKETETKKNLISSFTKTDDACRKNLFMQGDKYCRHIRGK